MTLQDTFVDVSDSDFLANPIGVLVEARRSARSVDTPLGRIFMAYSDLIAILADPRLRQGWDESIQRQGIMVGQHTTSAQLVNMMKVFCEHPDQWALVQADQTLVPSAVDEVLRFAPIIALGLPRIVGEDMELGGWQVPAGTMVWAGIHMARRDPEVYERPEEFDVTRTQPVRPLAFGHGPHYCVGAALAQLELVESLSALVRTNKRPTLLGEVQPPSPTQGLYAPPALPMAFV